jgi:hypothetical protein
VYINFVIVIFGIALLISIDCLANITNTNNANIVFRNNYNNIDDNIINLQDITDININSTEFILVNNYEANLNNIAFINFQGRLTSNLKLNQYYDYSSDELAYIDELYASVMLNNITFFGGRKKIINQVSYFYSTLDFLATKKRLDLGFEDKNIERSGQDMLGIEYLGENSGLIVSYIPYFQSNDIDLLHYEYNKDIKSVFFAKLSHSFADSELDVSLLYTYKDEHMGGVVLTKTIGENTILYLENKISQNPSFENNYNQNNKDYYVDLVVGLNYTTNSNINFILEYYHNNSGYNKTQWDNLMQDVNNAPVAFYPTFINSLYIAEYIKQNYISLRVANINIYDYAFYSMLSVNIDDWGNKITLGAEKSINNKLKISLENNVFNGNNKQEYGLVPYNINIIFTGKYFI